MNLTIAITPGVIFQEVQLGESLLLDVKTLAYYSFDPLGTRFWNALQRSPDADEALGLVAPTSELHLPELQKRFRAILSGLERSGLITLAKSSA
ncbi:MAG: PqqD family protein [Burkholderiales bacterium]